MYDFGKYTFTNEYKSGEKVTMEIRGDSTLDDLCETFERFLKASGFNIEGMTVEMVPQEEHDCCNHATEDADLVEPHRTSIDDATPEEWNAVNRKYTFNQPYAGWDVKFSEKK